MTPLDVRGGKVSPVFPDDTRRSRVSHRPLSGPRVCRSSRFLGGPAASTLSIVSMIEMVVAASTALHVLTRKPTRATSCGLVAQARPCAHRLGDAGSGLAPPRY